MPLKLLCIGDVHLGRVSSKIPADVGGNSVSPSVALRFAVDWAISAQVDAVLFAGDLVDSEKSRFEVLPVLEDAVRTLAEATIKVVTVAGNHDVDALPRLKKLIKDIHVLGSDGTWEEISLRGRDGTAIVILGWSFPRTSRGAYRDNPLELLQKKESTDPVIGLLHADLDVKASKYAPVTRAELEAVPVSAWLLGHIHKPDQLDKMRRPIGYLGSLSGLDPSEPGLHGAWLAEVDSGGAVSMTPVPLAPVRWEKLEVDVSSIDADNTDDTADELAALIKQEMEGFCVEIEKELDNVKCIGFRIFLTGRSGAAGYIPSALMHDNFNEGINSKFNDITLFPEKIISKALPALNVAEIAKGRDAAAIVAQRILALERADGTADEIIRRAGRVLPDKLNNKIRPYSKDILENNDALRSHLLEGAYTALDALYSQNQNGGGR